MAENVTRIEPCFLESINLELADLLAQIPAAAAGLTFVLHPKTASTLAELVRVMNCYYSNQIEGHNTRPRDIERALANVLDTNEERRNLQLEARAHIRVQREIDQQFANGALRDPTSTEFIRWLHREFYRDAPAEWLVIRSDSREVTFQPGEFRTLPEHEVAVGRHLPPSSERVLEFMQYFSRRFRLADLSPSEKLIAFATSHHRLNYIHPFADGNGRVSRLMSHALALSIGIGAHGLWSISRGLARGLSSRQEYRQMMDLADSPREGDLDGRGNLSLRRLNEFVTWFLKIALEQLTFMSNQFQLASLRTRLASWGERRNLRPEALRLLDELVIRGELPRGDARFVTRTSERSSRDTLKSLLEIGIIESETPKSPVYLRLSIESAEALFPDLFPQT
jgi:Fic family protein